MSNAKSATDVVKEFIAHRDTTPEDIKNLAIGLAVKIDGLTKKKTLTSELNRLMKNGE